MLLEPGAQRLVDQAFDHRTDFRGHKLVLGLGGEFRIGNLHREHRRQALAAVFPLQRYLLALQDARAIGIGGDLARQCCAEARHMGSAVPLRDVVGEAEDVLVIAVVPPECDLDGDAILLADDRDRLADKRLLGAVQIGDESFETAVIQHLFLLDLRVAPVGEENAHTGIQEGQFAQAMLQRRIDEFDIGEGFGARQEGDFRTRSALVIPGHRQRRISDAMGERHFVDLPATADLQLQLGR